MKEIKDVKDILDKWIEDKQEGHERGVLMIAYDFDGKEMDLSGMMDGTLRMMTAAMCAYAGEHDDMLKTILTAGQIMIEEKLGKSVKIIARDNEEEDEDK